MLKFCIMKEKLKKLVEILKNPRFLDIFCYVFCGIYLFCAICVAFINVGESKRIEQEMNNLLAQVNAVNKAVEKERLFNSTDDNQEEPSIPLFTDGKTALITAYNKLYEANSFHISINGQINTTFMDIALKVRFANTAIKFNEEKYYNELIIGYLDSSALQKILEEETQFAKRILKENKTVKSIESITTKYVNDKLVASNFYPSDKIDEDVKLIAENLMIVNEQTIKQISYFKTKKRDGKVQYYYVQAELDAVEAPKNFSKATAFSLGKCQLGEPKFKRCTFTACIDANGNLLGITSQDVGEVPVTSPLINLTIPISYTLTYVFNAINQEINFIPEGF